MEWWNINKQGLYFPHLLNNEIVKILLLFANLVMSLSYANQKYCLRNRDRN